MSAALTTDHFALAFVGLMLLIAVLGVIALYRNHPRPHRPPADPPEPNSIEEWRERAQQSQHRSQQRRKS